MDEDFVAYNELRAAVEEWQHSLRKFSELMQLELVVSPAAFERAVRENQPQRYPACYGAADELVARHALRAKYSDRILVNPELSLARADMGATKAAVFHEAVHVMVEQRHENLRGADKGSAEVVPAFVSMAAIAINETRVEKTVRELGAHQPASKVDPKRSSDQFLWTTREAVIQFGIDGDMRSLYEELIRGFLKLVVVSASFAAEQLDQRHGPGARAFPAPSEGFLEVLSRVPPASVHYERLRSTMIEEGAFWLDQWLQDLGFRITGTWSWLHVEIFDLDEWLRPLGDRNSLFSSKSIQSL